MKHPHSDLSCDHDCVNCDNHIDQQPATRLVAAVISPQGEITKLEEYDICPDCLGDNNPTRLLNYLRFALA